MLVFPHQTLERRLATPHLEADALRIDYLRLWLRARPDDVARRQLLVQQLTEAGDYAAARAQLDRLRDLLPAAQSLAIEFEIARREAYALPADDPRRETLLAALRERIAALAAATQDPAELAVIAGFAAEHGAAAAARDAYRRLLAAAPEFDSIAWAAAGQRMLAAGEPASAAALFQRALQGATTPGERRARLRDALLALEAAGDGAAALALARRHAADLSDDRDSLFELTRLARAANQPALALGFAHQLAAAAQRGPGFDDAALGLAHEALVAGGALDAAKQIAHDAVARSGGAAVWRQRLAQLADWTGDAPLALTQWHALARTSGAPRAWAEVERRAPQVLDHAAWLEALRFAQARAPGAQRSQAIVTAHELLGDPEAALDFLKTARLAPAEREWALETRARLAGALGREDERVATLSQLIDEFGASPARATELATAEFARRRTAAAWTALARARSAATPADTDYWNASAQLAQRLGKTDEAIAALRQLAAGKSPDESVYLNLVNLLAPAHPAAAAAVARAGYARHGTPYLAVQSLALAQRADEPAAARAWLAALGPAQLKPLLRNPDFLAARAQFRLAQGESDAALADARRGRAIAPDRADLVGLLLWAAIANHDAALTRSTLLAQSALALRSPELWPAWGAGWLALQDAPRALPWLRRQLAAQPRDPLLWLTYADALELAGDADLAWRARRHAWLDLRAPQPGSATINSTETAARLLGLTRLFEGGDAAPARLAAVLARRTAPGAREAAIGWAVGEGQAELAQAWMLARHARQLARPVWAELSVALAQDDRARLQQLIDSVADWLPVHDRISAARVAAGPGAAQALAHAGAERLPANDESHARLVAALLDPAVSSGIDLTHTRQAPLGTFSTTAHLGLRLSPERWLSLEASNHAHRSSNRAVIAQLPARDREAGITLGQVRDDGELRLQLGARAALADFATARIEGSGVLAGALQWNALGEWAGRAEDNAWLTLGALRDRAGGTLQWRLTPRESLSLAAEASRYRTQTGAAIGAGRLLRAEAGTVLRAAYPELAARLWWSRSDYSASGAIDASIAAILPPDVRGLDRRVLLPADAQQFGLNLSAGGSAAAGITRAWRPWGELSLYRDSVSGFNSNWTLGIAGSVLGSDRLAVGWAGGSASSANPIPYRRVGLSWQWFH